MKKLDKYICKQIIIGFLLVCFSLMSILWLSQSLRFLDFIASKGITVSIFVELTSLLMPRIFTILAPVSLFAAILFVYNRMLADQELVVMKSAGISPWQLARPSLFIGILLIFINIYVMNIAIPRAEIAFKDLEWKVKNNISHLMFREGEFTTLQKGLTVFVTKHQDDGSVSGILINDERNPRTRSSITAEKGVIIQNKEGPRIVLINGSRQEVNQRNGSFSSVSFEKYSVDFGIKGTKARSKNSVRVNNFHTLINALKDENLPENDRKKMFVEGNKRITTPLLSVVYALLGCVGLLISNFNRRGQTKTVIISLVAVILIQAIDLTAGNLATKHLLWLILLYANILLPISACLILLLYPNILQKLKSKTTQGEAYV